MVLLACFRQRTHGNCHHGLARPLPSASAKAHTGTAYLVEGDPCSFRVNVAHSCTLQCRNELLSGSFGVLFVWWVCHVMVTKGCMAALFVWWVFHVMVTKGCMAALFV